MPICIVGIESLPEIKPGDDLAALIRKAAERENRAFTSEDVVVIAQKVVSKAEGAFVDLRAIEPSAFARQWAAEWDKDARLVELVLRQARRIVRMDRGVLIVETCHGFIAANAGIDQSNVPGDDFATVLPRDPDESARRIHRALGCGAVIVSDTFGRPWREGLVNVAIGVSGLAPLDDCRGVRDRSGKPLHSTILAQADELAAAAGLVMKKSAGIPVAILSGVAWRHAEGSARELLRPAARDLFR